ncbi:hypothetical protein CDG60_09855 [Acinetobacter chinensis]|uniref:DUF551 domain-containing protein n=1 Tax=Acinetobacter chinensis TaxID=2004650 RepID=A0A3B7M2K9_9GAMM|nr:hypothetical protein [Acinetobacter chinensis]AXY56839.1 hypothetical protein CDG60_09855 [Acinetobacter chinensis]
MDIQTEQQAFEKWAFQASHGWASFNKDSDGKYWPDKLNLAWGAWKAAKEQAATDWISVNDVGPPIDEMVLVCWNQHPDVEPEKEYMSLDEDLSEYWPNCVDEPPTHWRKIPPPPKQAQEQSHD